MIIIMITTCIVHLKALLSQWGDAICVMVMRSQHAHRMQRSLGYSRRISYHYGSQFTLHYTPLNMDRADPPNLISGERWCAIVIHPISFDRRLVGCNGNVFIPELVLKAMFSGKCTLQLCAYTGESAMGVMEYLKNMKELHGVRL